MPIHRRLSIGAALIIAGVQAQAQDVSATWAARSFELPAHRALQSVIAREGAVPAPFTTDGCSGGMSQAWGLVADTFPDFALTHNQKPPWEECCVTHDVAYHNAGQAGDAVASFDARLAADRTLRACVVGTGEQLLADTPDAYNTTPDQVRTAYKTIAGAMYMAVRFGGAPCSGLPWRWGYGFEQCSVLTGAFD